VIDVWVAGVGVYAPQPPGVHSRDENLDRSERVSVPHEFPFVRRASVDSCAEIIVLLGNVPRF
jgi:hypothetical protein